MSNVINLGRERKRKQREAAKRQADENASKHGRNKAEKVRERKEQARLGATLDGARREPPRPSAVRPLEASVPAATSPPDEPDEPHEPHA